MRKSLSVEQWAALRAIAEHQPTIQARLAAAAGIHPTTLAKKSAAEEWRCLDFRRPAVRAALQQGIANAWAAMGESAAAGQADGLGSDVEVEDAAGLTGWPAGEIEASEEASMDRLPLIAALVVRLCTQLLEAIGSHRGSLTRPQLDTVHAITRLAEKLEPLAQEQAAELQKRSDEEIAGVLGKIEDQIILLGRSYALDLAARQPDG